MLREPVTLKVLVPNKDFLNNEEFDLDDDEDLKRYYDSLHYSEIDFYIIAHISDSRINGYSTLSSDGIDYIIRMPKEKIKEKIRKINNCIILN